MNRFGVSDVLADLSKRRSERRIEEGDSDSNSSYQDDSDLDEDFRPDPSDLDSDDDQGDSAVTAREEIIDQQEMFVQEEVIDSDEMIGQASNQGETNADGGTVGEDTAPKPKRRRNHKGDPTKWKRNLWKEARASGQEYKTYRGVIVPAKGPKPCDCSRCHWKCTEKISEVQRKEICNTFYALKVSTSFLV